MAFTIIEHGEGYTIAQDDEAHAGVPYRAEDRDDGNRNHGFQDLADQPELADTIPEAQRSAGLLRLLKTVNATGAPFMTVGCECGLFPHEATPHNSFDRYVGSYVAIVFRDIHLNSAAGITELARAMLKRVTGREGHVFCFEIIVTPLRRLFGHEGMFELHVNALGFGYSDEQAWGAFGAACEGLADAFATLSDLPREDLLFTSEA